MIVDKVLAIVSKLEEATSNEEDTWAVAMACASLAGHIINCCAGGEVNKKRDIKRPLRF